MVCQKRSWFFFRQGSGGGPSRQAFFLRRRACCAPLLRLGDTVQEGCLASGAFAGLVRLLVLDGRLVERSWECQLLTLKNLCLT